MKHNVAKLCIPYSDITITRMAKIKHNVSKKFDYDKSAKRLGLIDLSHTYSYRINFNLHSGFPQI